MPSLAAVGNMEAVHTHHVVAASILLNADIALGTLGGGREAQ